MGKLIRLGVLCVVACLGLSLVNAMGYMPMAMSYGGKGGSYSFGGGGGGGGGGGIGNIFSWIFPLIFLMFFLRMFDFDDNDSKKGVYYGSGHGMAY